MGPTMQPYEVSVLPQGSINARQATGADFGDAGALANFGQSVENAGARVLQVQNDQANIWASTAAAKQEVNIRQQWTQHVNSLDPTAPDYAQKLGDLAHDASSMWGDAVDNAVSQAPNTRAANFVREHMARAQVAFTGQVLAQQSGLNADYTTSMVKQDVSTRTDSIVAAGGSNQAYQDNLSASLATIQNLTSIGPQAKQQLAGWMKHSYAYAQASTVARQNPGAFLTSVSPDGGIQVPPKAAAPGQIQDFGADFVKPYTPQQIASVQQKAKAPSPYDAMFAAAGAKYGVDPQELKLRAAVESGLDPKADNGESKGLMQISNAEAKQLGINPLDPQQAIDAAAKLLAGYKAQGLNQDKAYYGGAGYTKVGNGEGGPNAQQYAANLAAVRASMGEAPAPQTPQVQPLTEQQVMNAHPNVAGWDELTFPEKMQMVRTAESKQGQALATGRANLRAQLQDANALHMTGQSAPADSAGQLTEPNLVAHFGPVEGPRMWQDYTTTKEFGATMATMATTPTAQLYQQLSSEKPTGADAAQLLPRWNQMAAAARATQKAQQAQWTDYAVKHGIGGAQPLDPKNDQEFLQGLAARQKLMQTGVQEYGIKKPTIFTASETQAIGNRLDTMNPTDRINFLVNMGRGLSDPKALQTAFNQIAPGREGLVSAARIAFAPGGVKLPDGTLQSGYDVGKMVATGDYILNGGMKKAGQPGSVDAPQPNGKGALGLNTKAFKQDFDEAVGGLAAFNGPNATYGSKVQSQFMKAAMDYYVADAYKRGLDVSQPTSGDVERAVDAVTGGVTRINKSPLFLPWGMDENTFRDQFQPRAMRALEAAGYDPDQVSSTFGNLIPVNQKDGTYGFMNGTQLLQKKNGNGPVIVDYSQPAPVMPQSWWTRIHTPVNDSNLSAVQQIGK